ncbi:MAG: hypothetical protein AVDCRST_MAG20-1416, partial [uncultured Acidimicrobiales bacterium]
DDRGRPRAVEPRPQMLAGDGRGPRDGPGRAGRTERLPHVVLGAERAARLPGESPASHRPAAAGRRAGQRPHRDVGVGRRPAGRPRPPGAPGHRRPPGLAELDHLSAGRAARRFTGHPAHLRVRTGCVRRPRAPRHQRGAGGAAGRRRPVAAPARRGAGCGGRARARGLRRAGPPARPRRGRGASRPRTLAAGGGRGGGRHRAPPGGAGLGGGRAHAAERGGARAVGRRARRRRARSERDEGPVGDPQPHPDLQRERALQRRGGRRTGPRPPPHLAAGEPALGRRRRPRRAQARPERARRAARGVVGGRRRRPPAARPARPRLGPLDRLCGDELGARGRVAGGAPAHHRRHPPDARFEGGDAPGGRAHRARALDPVLRPGGERPDARGPAGRGGQGAARLV